MNLENRVDTTLFNLNGSNEEIGLIEESRLLQQNSQKVLDNIIINELDKRIEEEIEEASINKGIAVEKIIEAEDLYIIAEASYQDALITKEAAERRLAESISWLDTLIENEKVVESIEDIQNEIRDLKIQSDLDKEYSETYRYRNGYNVDWGATPVRDEIGTGKLILIDEIGVPHIYELLTEPDYNTELVFPDGRKNYYSDGSKTRALNTIDDKLEIMSDGSYLLTKKDGSRYFYSYFGKLIKIVDTNDRYLDFTYNENHELVKISDTFSREIIINRNNGKISKITDPLGREYRYGYSGDRLVSFTDPEGNTRRYTYSEVGMTSTIYPDGNGWNYYYTEVDGRMVVDYQTDASGAVIDFEYDPTAKRTIVTNRRGFQRTYLYNDNHLTIEEIDADYGRVYKTYDENNNLISITNKRGYTTSYSYDENNNIISIADPVGTIYFSYNQFNKTSSMTDKNGYTTTYNYDYRGNLTSINYPDGGSRGFAYNNLGLLILETDQRGYQTRYTYDDYGNIAEIIYPDASIEKYQYDLVGRLEKVIKADGGEINYYYDNNGNITKAVDELGYEESFKYNSRNKIIEKLDPNGNITKYEYDERNNLKSIIDPTGNIQEIEYDEAENMTKKILAENVSYLYQYDKLDRLISATQVETGIETSYQYDPDGNLIALTDGEGRTTSYEYDHINRMTKGKDPLNNIVKYEYYPDNSLQSIKDKRGNTSNFKYDSMGRLVEVTNELNQKVRYEYDNTGNMTKKIDARGNSTSYEYDSMNRLIKEIDPWVMKSAINMMKQEILSVLLILKEIPAVLDMI